MEIDTFREYCLSKKGVTEGFPFDESVLAFKVMKKIFALTNIHNEEFTVNLKCDPDRAEELRAEYEGDIMPGYHMSKKHWNTVNFDGDLRKKLLNELIDHSYELVAKSLKKSLREELEAL